jgi:hypothetical protein
LEYRLFVLALRIAIGAIAALLSAIVVFYLGSVTVVPLKPDSDAMVTANLVIGAGLGAGLAGWCVGLRVGSNRKASWRELSGVLGLAVGAAWLGQLFLSDLLFANVDAIRIKTADEVYGALTGAVIGALAVPLALGARRTARGEEP